MDLPTNQNRCQPVQRIGQNGLNRSSANSALLIIVSTKDFPPRFSKCPLGGNTPPLRTTDLPPGLHPAPSISCSSSLRITAIRQVGSVYTHLTDEKREGQEGHGASGWKNLDLNSNLPNSKAHCLPTALHCLKLTGIKASQKGKGLKGNKGQE